MSADGEGESACSRATTCCTRKAGLKVVQSRGFGSRSEGEGLGVRSGTHGPSRSATAVVERNVNIGWVRERKTKSKAKIALPSVERTDEIPATFHVFVVEHLPGLNDGPADEEKQDKDRHARHHRFRCRLFSFHPFRRDSFFLSSLLRFLRLACGVA